MSTERRSVILHRNIAEDLLRENLSKPSAVFRTVNTRSCLLMCSSLYLSFPSYFFIGDPVESLCWCRCYKLRCFVLSSTSSFAAIKAEKLASKRLHLFILQTFTKDTNTHAVFREIPLILKILPAAKQSKTFCQKDDRCEMIVRKL